MAAANPENRAQESFELHISRVFDAPRDLVWDAWTQPAHMRHWNGPRHHPGVAFESDFRVGGAWRGVLKSVESGRELTQSGEYREIKPKEKLVYTFAWNEAHPAHGPDMLISVAFKDEGAKTRVEFTQQFLPSEAERDGHKEGWTSCFGRLDDLLVVTSDAGAKIVWLYPENEPVMLASRVFDAPRELVWECFTKAEHMAKWWGPRNYTAEVKQYDVRVGGKWRIAHTANGETWEFFGEFRELRRPDLFVWTFAFGEFPPAEEVFTFADLGGKTLLTSTSRYPTLESRNAMLETDMESGAEETYERLEELLQTL